VSERHADQEQQRTDATHELTQRANLLDPFFQMHWNHINDWIPFHPLLHWMATQFNHHMSQIISHSFEQPMRNSLIFRGCLISLFNTPV
jgi:hypothetical protein